jgi:hypothetical protein
VRVGAGIKQGRDKKVGKWRVRGGLAGISGISGISGPINPRDSWPTLVKGPTRASRHVQGGDEGKSRSPKSGGGVGRIRENTGLPSVIWTSKDIVAGTRAHRHFNGPEDGGSRKGAEGLWDGAPNVVGWRWPVARGGVYPLALGAK